MGHFILTMFAMRTFSKKPTTIAEQVDILQDRGMAITDLDRAKTFLSYCSYYRFCGYALHFEILTPAGERTHKYKLGTTFAAVEQIYHFDAALRRLIFHYTSLIEINFRGILGNQSAWYYNDPHWFLNAKNFQKQETYSNFLNLCYEEVNRSREIFVKSYKENYNKPDLPPIWMLTELMPFAVWSKLYQNLSDLKLRKIIAAEQDVPEKYLISWLQSLTVLRNACAHHARIWNRNFTQAPRLSPRIAGKIIEGQHKKIFVMFLIIYDLLRKLKRENEFANALKALFDRYPEIDLRNLGIFSHVDDMFA